MKQIRRQVISMLPYEQLYCFCQTKQTSIGKGQQCNWSVTSDQERWLINTVFIHSSRFVWGGLSAKEFKKQNKEGRRGGVAMCEWGGRQARNQGVRILQEACDSSLLYYISVHKIWQQFKTSWGPETESLRCVKYKVLRHQTGLPISIRYTNPRTGPHQYLKQFRYTCTCCPSYLYRKLFIVVQDIMF